jgi:hypothetical protein
MLESINLEVLISAYLRVNDFLVTDSLLSDDKLWRLRNLTFLERMHELAVNFLLCHLHRVRDLYTRCHTAY